MSERPLLVIERQDEAQAPDRDLCELLGKNWDDEWGVFDEAGARVYPLPFYEDVLLVEADVNDATPANARIYFLHHDGALFRLQGTSPPIHEVNGRSPPLLGRGEVLDYLAFFCFFVRGDEGPFLIVDRPSGRYVPGFPDEKALDDVFRSPQTWAQDENGDWPVSALVYYANALFYSDFLVELGGKVEMKNDHSILSDLPHRIDAPLEARRRAS